MWFVLVFELPPRVENKVTAVTRTVAWARVDLFSDAECTEIVATATSTSKLKFRKGDKVSKL